MYTDDSLTHLYVEDLDTKKVAEVVVPQFSDTFYDPKWSWNGEMITFSEGNGTTINLIDLSKATFHNDALGSRYVVEGNSFRRVAIGSGFVCPSFMAGDQQIVFHNVGGTLKVVNIDGTGLTDLGIPGGMAASSPDGTQISYTNWGFTYSSDIFAVQYDATTRSVVGSPYLLATHDPQSGFTWSRWSPDGTQLLLTGPDNTTVGNQSDIWVVDAKTKVVTKLTNDSINFNEANPYWAQGNKQIAFFSDKDGQSDVWAMLANGSGKANLTNSAFAENMVSYTDVPAVTINEGQAFITTGSFGDPGTDTWTAMVDYGDNSSPHPLVLSPDRTFSLNHVYAYEGVYTATVTVTDEDGGVGTGCFQVTVSASKPIIYVDDSATGANEGTSWANAYLDLQSALAVATDGTDIRVAQGTYKPTAGADRMQSFILKNGVSIFGGYAGYGAANPRIRDVLAFPTILSGDIGTVGDNSDNSYHVVDGYGVDATASLDGFTISGGNANGAYPAERGGGMLAFSSSPTLTHCIFSGK